jgi:hypothetical protein
MKKPKQIISLINLLYISLSITLFHACSYFNFNHFAAHELHLKSSHVSHHTHTGSSDEANHVHKHRHSENEKEHSHKHLNYISAPEIVINKIPHIKFYPIEIHSVTHFVYNIKSYDSYILEILKPPIHS